MIQSSKPSTILNKLWVPPLQGSREQTPAYAKQSHGEEKKSNSDLQTSRKKERQQVQEQVWWDVTDGDVLHEPRHRVCGGQVSLQSSQEAKLSLAPRTAPIKADLLTGKHGFFAVIHGHGPLFKQEVRRGVGRNLPPVPSNIHNIHWCTVTMDLCYPGESVTRNNFYLTSPRATLKQNAALSLPLLRCLIWQLRSSFIWKLSTVLLRSLISEWMGK